MKKHIVLMLILSAAALPAAAEIYRWVDAQGRVHFSDTPVEGAQRVSIASRASDPEAIAERAQAARQERQKAQEEDRARQVEQAAARQVQKDVAKVEAERCKKAQEDYRIATESLRLYRIGKDGEREYLTSEEITAARINALKARDEACKQEK